MMSRGSTGREGPRGAPGWRPAHVLWLGLAMGSLTGVGEAVAAGVRHFALGRVTRITPDVFWMAPAVYAILFVLVGFLLLSSRRGRERPGPAVFLMGTLALTGWLSIPAWSIHPAAVVLLAAGIATQLARFANRHAYRIATAARPVGAIAPAVVAILGISYVLGDRWRENRAFTTLPEPPAEATNVLLLVLDTVRAKSLGLYGGSPAVSPGLDALAASSIVFERATSPAPWTLPSHASMFTGRWPHELSSGWNRPLDGSFPTLAELLRERGYATAGFVANLLYTSRPMGLARGFVRYEDYPRTFGQAVLASGLGREIATGDPLRDLLDEHELLDRKPAGRLRRDLLRWLDDRPERPFFAFVNFFDAHEPYEPPDTLRARFGVGEYRRKGVEHAHELLRGVSAKRQRRWESTPGETRAELALYEAAIAALDAETEALIRGLEARGILQNTVVIVTSDHGEMFGEHGMYGHLQSLYRPLTHVPLLIRLPGGAGGGTRIANPVSLRDIAATILDLVAAEGEGLPGGSLATLWDPDRTPRVSRAVSQLERGLVEQPWYPIARGFAMQAMASGTLHYVCNPDGTEELYDLSVDPDETRNLAEVAAVRSAVLDFRARIATVGAPPPSCPPPPRAEPRAPETRP